MAEALDRKVEMRDGRIVADSGLPGARHRSSEMSRRRRAAVLRPARLRPADIVRLGGTGLRTRPLRVFLSALGIAIGVAAMVAVVGISSSSRAEVDRKLDQLGTNMLRVAPGQTPEGETTRLPKEAVPMIGRIGPVQQVAATGTVKGAAVYRNEHVPVGRTSSVEVAAAGSQLLPHDRRKGAYRPVARVGDRGVSGRGARRSGGPEA